MGPKVMLLYAHEHNICRHMRTICEDITKKARTSREHMWKAIFYSRAGYWVANPSAPTEIEPSKWPLPGPQELGPLNTSTSLIPKNPRGRVSMGVANGMTNGIAASNSG